MARDGRDLGWEDEGVDSAAYYSKQLSLNGSRQDQEPGAWRRSCQPCATAPMFAVLSDAIHRQIVYQEPSRME